MGHLGEKKAYQIYKLLFARSLSRRLIMTQLAAEQEIGLNDKYLRIWGVPLIALSGLLSLMQFFFAGRWDLFGKYLLVSLVYTFVTWEICRWAILLALIFLATLSSPAPSAVKNPTFYYLKIP